MMAAWPDDARVTALSEALRCADADEARPLAEALLDIRTPAPASRALTAVISAFDRLPDDLIQSALRNPARSDRIAEGLMQLTLCGRPQQQARCLEALANSGRIEALEAATRIVCERHDAALRESAVTVLCEAVGRLTRRPRSTVEAGLVAAADALLARAADAYDTHREDRVLIAAAECAALGGPALARWLEGEDAGQMALRGVVRRQPEDVVLANATWWLGTPALAPQVSRMLEDRRLFVDSTAVPGSAHLLEEPRRRARLARVRQPRRPAEPAHLDMTAASAAWLARLPLPPEEKAARLGEAISAESAEARLTALRGLIELGAPGVERCADFCFDADEMIARLALRHTLRSGEGTDVVRRCLRSPHPSVRATARAWVVERNFNDAWRAWAAETVVPGVAVRVRALYREQRESFAPFLRQRLTADSRDEALRAMRMIADLHAAGDFEPALIAAAASGDAYVAATAVRLLGTIDSEASLATVRAALEHANGRVRANAVEALPVSALKEAEEAIIAMTGDPHNRLRANAAAALLAVDRRRGVAAVAQMLEDGRALHRLSGVWAAEAEELSECASALAQLAARDPAVEVGARAKRALRGLRGRGRAA